jgi:CheY-like chemotaxis protein
MIVLLLGMHGFDVLGACDGLHALEQIRRRGRPGIVFLDLRMPRMNGPDFVQALRQDSVLAAIPIVVMSGDAMATDVAAALGAAKCLVKPLTLPQLLEAIVGFTPTAVRQPNG